MASEQRTEPVRVRLRQDSPVTAAEYKQHGINPMPVLVEVRFVRNG